MEGLKTMFFWICGEIWYNTNPGDVLHRRSTYFKKRQADFDPLSRPDESGLGILCSIKQGQNKKC
jgi:hypothetical protein